MTECFEDDGEEMGSFGGDGERRGRRIDVGGKGEWGRGVGDEKRRGGPSRWGRDLFFSPTDANKRLRQNDRSVTSSPL